MKKVRIAAGAGYAGDRIEAALDIISADAADYIIFECLAERTIALAQKEKLVNPDKGYNSLLEYRMERILPLLKKHKVKIITNMGAANPVSAARKTREMANDYGLTELKIAVVTGDDVLPIINKYYDSNVMENDNKLGDYKENIVSANAYIGAQGITKALEKDADIVITGRVSDPSLTVGPLVHEFNKTYDDYDFLGKATVAGHLLECGGQATGGYYADPGKKNVDRLWEIGFPIVEFFEDGSFEITKLPNSGGLISSDTIKEQLLYEIQDPSCYITPDVIADFSNISLKNTSPEHIKVLDATGKEKTGSLKVGVGFKEGFIGVGEISYGGINCIARARLAAEIISHRLDLYDEKPLEKRVDIIGINSLYKNSMKIPEEIYEVRLRYAIRSETKHLADILCDEVEALYTNGPAGGGGARGYVKQIISIVSILIDEKEICLNVEFV